MEAEAENICIIPSVSDMFIKEDSSPPELLYNFKTEFTEDSEIYDACSINSEAFKITPDALNSYLGQDEDAQLQKNTVPILSNINDNIPNEENISTQDISDHQTQQKSNDPKPMLLCGLCGYRTPHAGHMRVHVVRHEAPKASKKFRRYRCGDCGYETKKITILKLHRRRHKKEKPPDKIFEKCSVINSHNDIYQAIKKETEEVKMLQCPDCDYKTDKAGRFKVHSMRHKQPREPRVLMCEKCGYQTIRRSSLYIHKRRHKKEEQTEQEEEPELNSDHFLFQETYQCKDCEFYATNKRQLYRHNSRRHKDKEVKKVKGEVIHCNFCEYQTTLKHCFRSHLKSHSFIVTENDMYKCKFCDFRATRNVNLKVHMVREHNSDGVTMNRCEHCSYESLYKSDFKKHLLTHKKPEEVNMWKCSECNYKTLHKSNLNTHKIRHHRNNEEIEMFQCYNCEYKSPFKYRLKEHIVVHMRPNPQTMNKCPHCSYETVRRKNLLAHIRLQHNRDECYVNIKDTC